MSGLGIVLSGGGARGAYEAGVLSYVFGDLVRHVGRVPRFDYVCGTSVGAFTGAWLAGVMDDPVPGVPRLVHRWAELRLEDVLRFGFTQAAVLHRVLLGGPHPTGIFDARPLARLVRKSVPWRNLRRNLAEGRLRALTVTTTHVASGCPVVFVHRAPATPLPQALRKRMELRDDHILPSHVLASASIPLVFPPVQIRGDLHCDGGLRLNTPMSPALHLGADRLFVIGVAPGEHHIETPALDPGRYPGAPFLIGKVLNAFLLDHVTMDLEELDAMNRVLEDGTRAFGPDFVDKLNAEALLRGDPPRKIVRTTIVRPTVDIGRLAADHVRKHRARFGRTMGRTLLRLLDLGEGADSDLASYLLFDGEFAQKLIELGRSDAASKREELAAFFGAS